MLTAADFSNAWSADMAGLGKEDYKNKMEEWLAKLDALESHVKTAKIKTLTDYQEWDKWKGLLSSLFCYAFNNEKGDAIVDRIADIDCSLGDEMYRFAIKWKKPSKELRIWARYLVWGRNWTEEEPERLKEIFLALKREDLLRKKPIIVSSGPLGEYAYYLVGLHRSVGDNVFSVNGNRQYRSSCALQAFAITETEDRDRILEEMEIPELEECCTCTPVGNHKGGARISITQRERRVVYDKLCA